MNIEERTKYYREHRELTGHESNCADPGGCKFIELLLEEVEHLKGERSTLIRTVDEWHGRCNKLKKWVDDLQSGMYINCVYCGHRYGPSSEVSPSMDIVLKEHIEQCSKHPMSLLKTQYVKLLDDVTEFRDWANRIANDERVCNWVHQEDYSLYCLLTDCPVDFDKVFEGVHGKANDTIEAAERLTTLLKEEK